VLFFRGDLSVIDRFPRVALVGTRSATRYGLGLAAQLGAELATGAVSVVSGLALGIDGAAHEGACAGWEAGRPIAAPPVAVVAGGLDDPYPRRHATLFERVARCDVIVSESPIGAPDLARRFPQRNRILAALAEVVVVVECHLSGGSLHTVRAAARRGIAVGAVPGSVRSSASAGTNDLLADGCFVVRDVTDVRVALGLARAGADPVRPRDRRAGTLPPTPTPFRPARAPGPPAMPAARAAGARAAESVPDDAGTAEQRVLGALGAEQCSLEQLLWRSGLSLAALSAALERLEAAGTVVGDGGWWSAPSPGRT